MLQDLLKFIFDFVIVGVIFKIIIGHWMAKQIMKYGGRWISSTERNMAIWTHYQNRAAGQGHSSDSVLVCTEGQCTVFQP